MKSSITIDLLTGIRLIALGLILLMSFSCNVKSGEQDTPSGNEPLPPEPNKVEIMLLEKSDCNSHQFLQKFQFLYWKKAGGY